MDDVKKAIIAGLDILSQQDLRNIFIQNFHFSRKEHAHQIAVARAKAADVRAGVFANRK